MFVYKFSPVVELSEYLIDLVFRQKAAIVPELGTFKFVTAPAKMNFGENTLYPPSQHLIFTESTFEQGEVSFQDFLVREKGFDPHEAAIRIKAYVHQIRNNLHTLGYSYIPGFGTLHLLENETLRFTPGDKIKAMKPTLGLPELKAVPVSREFVKDDSLLTEVEATTFIDNRSEKVTSEKNRWAVPALITFVLLGFGLIAYYVYINKIRDPEKSPQAIAPVVNEDSLLLAEHGFVEPAAVEDSVADKAAMLEEIDHHTTSEYTPDDDIAMTSSPRAAKEKKEAQPVPEAPKEKAVENTLAEEHPSDGRICAVIVGAMANPDNARRLARQVRKAGFQPYSFKSKGLTKVGASCNCDTESIESTLEAMKKINAAAWVYESD